MSAIDGVRVTPLRRIPDERGDILHMLRSDAEHFTGFGEVYFSFVYPGMVKAWHLHREMTLNYAVPIGDIRLVCYDDRVGSPTRGVVQELVIGRSNYALVTMPPLVWNGFMSVGNETAMVANCTDLPHDPEEIDRLDAHSPKIPYSWETRNG